MNILNELQAAVDELSAPTTAAVAAARAANIERTTADQAAAEAERRAHRYPGPDTSKEVAATRHAAATATARYDAAATEAVRLRDLLTAATAVRDTAQREAAALDWQANHVTIAATARADADEAAAAVATAKARCAVLRDQIEANAATLALHRAALDAAVVANDRQAWMNAQFDVQVGERAIADDSAELAAVEASRAGLENDARDARIKADKVAARSALATFAATIDWDAMPVESVTLHRRDRSVR